MGFVTNHWDYVGDVNLEQGGTFAKLDPSDLRYGYADVVEVTDLDSAAGATGMVLIEKGTVNFDRERIRKAIGSCGWFPLDRAKWPSRSARKAMMVQAVKSYYGMDVDDSEVIRTDAAAPARQDGWHGPKVVQADDLGGYVAAKYLD